MKSLLLALTIALLSACGQVPSDTVKCDAICQASNDEFFLWVYTTIEHAETVDECNDSATIDAAYIELEQMQDDMSIQTPAFLSITDCLEQYDAEFSWYN